MKQILPVVFTLAIAACSWNQHLQADDGAPIAIAVKHPIQNYQRVSLGEASQWGLDAYSLDTGDGQYGLYLLFNNQLRNAVQTNRASLNISVWSGGQLVLSVPGVCLTDSPFIIQEGYRLQVLLDPNDGYAGLTPGTGYYVLLDPREHVKAL